MNIALKGISGGYKAYLLNIIPRLASDTDIEAILCGFPEVLKTGDWFKPLPNVELVNYLSYNFLSGRFDKGLHQKINKFSPDVIFVPVEKPVEFNNIPVVTMIQNMESLAGVNENNPVFERVQHWFRIYLAKQGIKKADRIIAISKFVKEYLVNNYNVPDDKIGLVYYGTNNPQNSSALRPSMLPFGWDKEFVFTAGSIRPMRGLEDIFLAMHYLIKEKEWPVKLVIAGEANPNMVAYKNKLKRWIEKLGISDNVCWTSHLDDSEMVWCYENCKMFIMSSRVESFGRISLEAMSHGCICVSANNPCLPEIFKDAAIYYSPKDSQSLAKSIKTVLNWDSMQKEEVVVRARNRAAMFSWDVCATKTVTELVKAIKNRKIKNVK